MNQEKPKIGVGVVVTHLGRILLGKRRNSHGEGSWAFPGGHLEFGETVEDCASRELLEETGLTALELKKGPWVSNIIDGKHYITLFVYVDKFSGDLALNEPEKCEEWIWFSSPDLPTPLFPPIESLLQQKINPQQLLQKIVQFHEERDWAQFHSPKNLVMDLAAEVGELIEPFRWLTESQSFQLDDKALENVKDEIGDVLKIVLYLSHKLGIDPLEVTEQKLVKMAKKYPINRCRGKALKYTYYENSID